MIERIAKIVCEKPWPLASANQKRNAVITAKAILKAMYEPTKEMVNAAPNYQSVDFYPSDVWQAMLEGAIRDNHPNPR